VVDEADAKQDVGGANDMMDIGDDDDDDDGAGFLQVSPQKT